MLPALSPARKETRWSEKTARIPLTTAIRTGYRRPGDTGSQLRHRDKGLDYCKRNDDGTSGCLTIALSPYRSRLFEQEKAGRPGYTDPGPLSGAEVATRWQRQVERALTHESDGRTSGRLEVVTLFPGHQSAGKSSPIPRSFLRQIPANSQTPNAAREPWRRRGACQMRSRG
jgi:hypothetical protein